MPKQTIPLGLFPLTRSQLTLFASKINCFYRRDQSADVPSRRIHSRSDSSSGPIGSQFGGNDLFLFGNRRNRFRTFFSFLITVGSWLNHSCGWSRLSLGSTCELLVLSLRDHLRSAGSVVHELGSVPFPCSFMCVPVRLVRPEPFFQLNVVVLEQ